MHQWAVPAGNVLLRVAVIGGYRTAVLNDLPDRLDLELIGVPLRAHNHLRLSHSLWLRGVYGTLGDSVLQFLADRRWEAGGYLSKHLRN